MSASIDQRFFSRVDETDNHFCDHHCRECDCDKSETEMSSQEQQQTSDQHNLRSHKIYETTCSAISRNSGVTKKRLEHVIVFVITS
jgi:hypothetical protein